MQLTMRLSVVAVFVLIYSFAAAADSAKRSYLKQKYFEADQQVSIDDALKRLDGRVIYIEADSPYRGRWMYAENNYLKLDVQAKDQIVESAKHKWRFVYFGNQIALENMEARNTYVSNQRYGGLLSILAETGYPQEDDRVKMFVPYTEINANGALISFQLRFTQASLYIGVLTFGARYDHVTLMTIPEKWWVYIPETSDGYNYVDSVDNSEHNRDVEWSYTSTVGISNTEGHTITKSLEVSLGFEISGAFGKFSSGLKYTTTWQDQKSQTFSKSVSRTVKTTVAAGARLEVRQLTGNYGKSFEIRADNFKFKDLNSGEVHDSIEEFNQVQVSKLENIPGTLVI